MAFSLSTSVGLLLGMDFLDLARRGVCERRAATSSLAVFENKELAKTSMLAEGGGSGLWLVGEASACSEQSVFDWFACHIARKADAMFNLAYSINITPYTYKNFKIGVATSSIYTMIDWA